ncbi:glutamate receptor ionotropic, kainate 4-like [Zootermopsis nevadensis]|nr:glutamate receptor ionotropic, kainate 4-like [Zootermopsis nevadensis]
MREIDFMPDLVIARFVAERNLVSGYSKRTLPVADSSKAEGNLTLELITHRFVGQNPSERVSLDMWMPTMDFLYKANLYPDKISNLMGKHITMTTMHYPPLTVIDENADPPIYDGLELRFIYEWARAVNFTWSIVYDGGWWGDVWPNGSGDGLCGLVSSDIADVGFSAIYLWDNAHLFLDFSSIYFGSSLTVVTPRPKLLPGWMVPIHPFNPDMWYAVGMSVIGCTLALYITSKTSMRLLGRGTRNNVVNLYSTWVECAFRTMGLLVLQVPPDERDFSTPRHVPMRHLVTWLILFYFVVTTAYCGGLATVLTLPRYEKPIESVSDLADHNLIWGGMDDAFTFIMRGSSDPKMQTVVRNFRLESEEYLTARAKVGDMGFVIERMLGGHFYMPSFVNEETMQRLRVMKGNLYFSHTVYVLRKGSPLETSINNMIQWVRDAGLFVFWEGLTVRNYMSSPRQHSVINSRNEEDMGPTKLLLQHVSGAFYMLGFGLAVSLVILIFELVRFKFRQIVEK